MKKSTPKKKKTAFPRKKQIRTGFPSGGRQRRCSGPSGRLFPPERNCRVLFAVSADVGNIRPARANTIYYWSCSNIRIIYFLQKMVFRLEFFGSRDIFYRVVTRSVLSGFPQSKTSLRIPLPSRQKSLYRSMRA